MTGIQDARDPRIHEEKLERIEARGPDGQVLLPQGQAMGRNGRNGRNADFDQT